MNYSRIFFVAIFVISISSYVTAQNRKEQILILSGKIDSLNATIGIERENHQIAISKSQKKIILLDKGLLLSKGQTDSAMNLLEKERAFNKDLYERFQREKLNQEKNIKELIELNELLVKERDSLKVEVKNLESNLNQKHALTIKIDTLELIYVEKDETCEALYFRGLDDLGLLFEVSFYLGMSSNNIELNDNFFIENSEYGVYEGNEALIGKYYIVTLDTSSPYLFYDCGPLGDEERRHGEGRPASLGFQLLSIKKL